MALPVVFRVGTIMPQIEPAAYRRIVAAAMRPAYVCDFARNAQKAWEWQEF
jgi:hypothetical protein